MSLKTYLIGQFKRPRGPLGYLAGRIMANRPSNRLRNDWTVDLLDLRPGHRVLEIGYGPGLALEQVARTVREGRIVGLDHSAAMRRQATKRNRAAIAAGRTRLLVGSVEDGAVFASGELAGPFDRIFGANVAMFWRDQAAVFGQLGRLLAPDGMIAFTHQPRVGAKTDAAALATAEAMKEAMAWAGLVDLRIERRTGLSPLAVCVIGRRAAA